MVRHRGSLRCKRKAYGVKHRTEEAEYGRLWRKRNPERVKCTRTKWDLANPEKVKASRKRTKAKHRAKNAEYTRLWCKRNPERMRHLRAGRSARDRAIKLQAQPKWLSPEQLLEIRAYYRQAVATTKATGIDHAVDHIVPLCGANVCGLHVPWNLQVLTRLENCQKGITLQVSEGRVD